MNKFKFKLDGLLKLREFKEKQLKVELGNILKEIQSTKNRVALFHEHITEAYKGQEQVLVEAAKAEMLKFFPYFIQGKKAAITKEEEQLVILGEQYEVKVKEMTIARGETKVIGNLKEKEKKLFVKEKRKKDFEKIEEIRILRQGNGDL